MALCHCKFFSEVLGLSTAMDVIIPQNTERQIGKVFVQTVHWVMIHSLAKDS